MMSPEIDCLSFRIIKTLSTAKVWTQWDTLFISDMIVYAVQVMMIGLASCSAILCVPAYIPIAIH